ncbi:hypothetical protein BVRB_7g175410 isoform A [Beta vulgaris subsp. vulgaris]|nr:hypothetical protein BVRB_7g175410 isoform A [Beta vulgaris subsp. vulgaris]
MSCFFGGCGNPNKKKRSEKLMHNSKQIIDTNYKNKAEDRTSSTSAAKQQLDSKRNVNVTEDTREVVSSSDAGEPGVIIVSVDGETSSSKARTFTYQELVDATDNFRSDCFLGEGGFGKVYKGQLTDTSEVVAIKRLDRNGLQGIREFVVEVLTLSLADHPNLVKLIGYCAEGDQRLLVYEYMPLGSLESHLHGIPSNKKALDWNVRMKIAAGAARGLEYLHDKMKPPVIYRDLKCSNILLGEGYHPKLSDFGLAKVGPSGDKTHVSTRVMGGREQNLVAWARPLFKDRRKFCQMADPTLQGQYPTRGLYQALAIAAMCVQEQPTMRPLVADVVTALNYLASQIYDPQAPNHRKTPSSSNTEKASSNHSKKPEAEDDSQSENDSEG